LSSIKTHHLERKKKADFIKTVLGENLLTSCFCFEYHWGDLSFNIW